MKVRIYFGLVVLLSALLLVACSEQNEQPVVGPTPDESPSLGFGIRPSKAGGGSTTPAIGELHNEVLAAYVPPAQKSSAAFLTSFTTAVNTVATAHGLGTFTEEYISSCGCELESKNTVHYDFFPGENWESNDFEAFLIDLESTGVMTSIESEWLSGLHEVIWAAPDEQSALNAVITYGMQYGFPYPDTSLGASFSVYMSSLNYWTSTNKGLWDTMRANLTIGADAIGAFIGWQAGLGGLSEKGAVGASLTAGALASIAMNNSIGDPPDPGG